MHNEAETITVVSRWPMWCVLHFPEVSRLGPKEDTFCLDRILLLLVMEELFKSMAQVSKHYPIEVSIWLIN